MRVAQTHQCKRGYLPYRSLGLPGKGLPYASNSVGAGFTVGGASAGGIGNAVNFSDTRFPPWFTMPMRYQWRSPCSVDRGATRFMLIDGIQHECGKKKRLWGFTADRETVVWVP